MKRILRLSLFWTTTLVLINQVNGQITFVNPPADTVVTCDNFISFPEDPEVIDDCPGNPFVFFFDNSSKSNRTDTCAFYEYTVIRTFSAMNSCSDTATYTQIITVVDTFVPDFSPPPAVTVNCADLDDLSITGTISQNVDQCGGILSRTYVDEVKPVRCDSTIERTWTLTDVCGNTRSKTQLITVIDEEPPFFLASPRDVSVMCSMTENPFSVFNDWVNNAGYAEYLDQCNEVNFSFSAVPGSYDLDDPSTFPGEHPRGLDPPNCGAVDGAFQFEQVDFVIVDQCGNAHSESATFYFIDDESPILGDCQPDITVTLDGSDCFTTITYEVPEATDLCMFEDEFIFYSDTQEIMSDMPGDQNVTVNEISFTLGPIGPETTFSADSNFFDVILTNFDGDGDSETFVILDENNNPIGISPNSTQECGSISFQIGPFPRDLVEDWIDDRFIRFRMLPSINATPENGINDICFESTAIISFNAEIQRAVDPVQIFFRLDEQPFELVTDSTIDVNIPAGDHVVSFMAKDCAGNSTTCPQRVIVRDNVAPQLNCGVSRQVDTGIDLCGYPLVLSEIAMINNPCNEDINVNVSIEGSMNTLVSGDYEALRDSITLFPVGSAIIVVDAVDFSGNQSNCTFNIEVEDNQLPNAVCNDAEVPAVAVQLEDFNVDPFLLGGNSTDNCGIANIVVENNDFSCSDLEGTFTKTVLVIDQSGNISTCNSTFSIIDEEVPISYTVGICPEDSLKFFLNIPDRNEYVYLWSGPRGFSSVLAEPFIPAVSAIHEGQYDLTIRNVETGCESTATIDVLIDDVKEPILYTDAIGCETLPHVLSTDPVAGPSITYDWYLFEESGRTLLLTTDTSVAEIPLEPGNYTLGVVVANEFCESRPSNRISVEVRVTPDGAICTNLIEACIGQPLELCVDDPNDNIEARWFGPNGFMSSEERPTVTDSFAPEMAGVYKLVIEENECITDTLTTSVISNETPPTPQILGRALYCVTDTIALTSSIGEEGDIFVWHSPSGIIRNNQRTLRIPIATSNFNGEWRLSIERGPCTSELSEPIVVDIEPPFVFEISTIQTQCEGASVTLTTSGPPEGFYEWIGPNGFRSNEFNPTVDVVEGTYNVRLTTRNGCEYVDNKFINTVVIPRITGVSVSEEGPCLLPESTVSILPSLSESADVFYDWVGPDIQSVSSTLLIEDYSFSDNGVYGVKIFNGACESDLFTFPLNYIISPVQPIMDVSPIACLGDTLVLNTNQYGQGTTYQWNTPDGMVETSESRYLVGAVSQGLAGEYSVQVTQGMCTSAESQVVDITVNENVLIPEISSTGEQCLQSTFKLFTNFSEELTLEWELPNGQLLIADTLLFDLQVEDAGQYRVRSYFDGCPSLWSSPVFIDVADPRIGLSLASSSLFSCNNDDSGLEFCVEDNSGVEGERYRWFLGDELIGESLSTCYEVEDPSIFAFGLNEISLRIIYNGCEVSFDETLILEIENVRNINASAGEDQLFCVGDGLLMNADEVNTDKLSAFWSVEAGVEVDDINDPMATITVLEDLDSTFAIWNVDHIECGIVYRDTVVLKQKTKPLPMVDSLIMDNNEITFNPLDNDILIDGNNYDIREVGEPRWGEARISGNEIIYRADPKFIGGIISFSYTVCDDACAELCNEGEIILLYNAESCKGNNVLTPNNDGVNDRFVIPCVENETLPNSTLVILNELGNTIFEQSPYDNSWDGTFNGEPLQEGTYYYIFRKDENATVVQGFISIER